MDEIALAVGTTLAALFYLCLAIYLLTAKRRVKNWIKKSESKERIRALWPNGKVR